MGLAPSGRRGRLQRLRGSSGSRCRAQALPRGLGEDSAPSTSSCAPFSRSRRGVELPPRALDGTQQGTEGERRREPELGHIGPGEKVRGERPEAPHPPSPSRFRRLRHAVLPTLGAGSSEAWGWRPGARFRADQRCVRPRPARPAATPLPTAQPGRASPHAACGSGLDLSEGGSPERKGGKGQKK